MKVKSGCEFLARMFEPKYPTALQILTLDYNKFGNEGMLYLITGFKTAKCLTYLSLAYCDITEVGIKYMHDYLVSPSCTLEKLNIQGNPLKNVGMNILIQSLSLNTTIEELNINNILFGKDDDTIVNLVGLMTGNTTLLNYQLKFNLITDKGNFVF